MKTLCIALSLITLLPAAAVAQSGTVNVDEVYTIRSVYGGGQHLVLRPDRKGKSYTADISSSTQILAKNRPLAAERLRAGWHVEIRGSRAARQHIKAEVVVVQRT